MIKEFIGIDINKQFQNSDFGGELSPSQLKYCANDVIYLHKIHEELNKILIREKRINLYKDCLKFMKTRVELDLAYSKKIFGHTNEQKKFISVAKDVINLEIKRITRIKKKYN